MPLVTCPDCHHSVSDAAPACIHCGRPNPAVRPAPSPRRRHPLAGTDAANDASPRAVVRGACITLVMVLVGAGWVFDGGSGGRGDLLSGLISLGIGASLLVMPGPEEPARTPGAPRADWGAWFERQEARRDFRWNRVAGWVMVAVGAVYLLIAAM